MIPAFESSQTQLAELIAIHREIAAMVRAGIPLELGLKTFSGGLRHPLGRMADRIARRLSEGQSLAQAVEAEGTKDFPVYGAVIGAGLESGRLPEALEAVATSAEIIRETRSHLATALIYPAAVVAMAYFLFCGFVGVIVPRYLSTAKDMGFADQWVFQAMEAVHATEPIWWWAVPAGLFALVFAFRYLFGLRLLPRDFLVQLLGRAQFAELLRLQVSHGVPIGSAFRRAANGSGDAGLRVAADTVCSKLEDGVPFSTAVSHVRGLPPLMAWMLSTGERQGTLDASLTLIRDSNRRRAAQQAFNLRTWLPALATVLVGGTAALTYSLLNFIPLRAFWEGLMIE